MEIEFKGISNPRQGYDFGPAWCTKCGNNTTAFLEIRTWKEKMLLCKGCLMKGEDIINKTILSQCRRRGEG